MNKGWKTVKLGDVVEIIDGDRGKNYPSQGDFKDDGFCVFLNTKNVPNTVFNFDNIQYISKEKDGVLNNGKLKRNDIVLTTRGTLGNVALYNDRIEYQYIRINSGMVIIRNLAAYNTKFLYLIFTSYIVKKFIEKTKSGSAQPQLPIRDLKNLELPLPPLAEQERIASILSAFDDKIEANRKICADLEAAAKVLFRKNFIAHPDRDSWEEVRLGDVAEVIGGYSYNSKELMESSMGMVTIKNFNREGGFQLEGIKGVVPAKTIKEHLLVDIDDVLVAHTDLTQKAEIIGNPILILSKGKYDTLIPSMDVVKIQVFNTKLSNQLLYLLLSYKDFKDHALGYVNGTTVLHLSKKALPEYSFRMPANNIIENLNTTICPMFEQIKNFQLENRTLARARDLLLPRLMRGDL